MNQDMAPLAELCRRLQGARMRAPLLVTGTAAETLMWVSERVLPAWQSGGDGLWLSSRAPAGAWCLPSGKANHELGREAAGVVVDLFDGCSVDVIAAMAGVVRAGGLLVFLAPPLSHWPAFDDPEYARLWVEPGGAWSARRHFLTRLARRFAEDDRLVRLDATGLRIPPFASLEPARPLQPDGAGCLTWGQRQVVDALVDWAQRGPVPPLVVQADRGRGKSAALGLAARQLVGRGMKILVTAPRPEAAHSLLHHAGETPLSFYAPDRLLLERPAADLLLVDEAAALAPAMVKSLLVHWPRVVLATTVQGYEGTGQGFSTRFARHLDQHFHGWQLLTLNEPVRWAAGDPLEAFINDHLLLDACNEPEVPLPQEPLSQELLLQELQCQELTPLLADLPEARLRAAHGLLVAAHYRTRPSDLRTLLDGANMRAFIVCHQTQVVAVALVAEEGRLPAPLATDILAGKRRPRGHVLAQSLAVHLNVEAALEQPCWRIVRIAVHSRWQRRGVGHWLLQQLEQQARQEAISHLGSLFAAADDVLAFWQHAGFDAVRLGITREATSGAFPVLVCKGLSAEGHALTGQARQRFEQTFLHSLADTPEPWPSGQVMQVWQQARFAFHEPLFPADADDIRHFIAGHKTFENAAVALTRQTRIWMAAGLLQDLPPDQQQLLIGKLLQKRPWPELVEQGGFSGQKQARQRLRDAIFQLESKQPCRATL